MGLLKGTDIRLETRAHVLAVGFPAGQCPAMVPQFLTSFESERPKEVLQGPGRLLREGTQW